MITKKLWTYIKSKRQDNIGGVGPLDFQGETHTDPLIKANIFADYFSLVFTTEDISNIPSMEGAPLPWGVSNHWIGIRTGMEWNGLE